MALSSCAVRVESLEGMGFLTKSGSTRTVQRDSRYMAEHHSPEPLLVVKLLPD